MKREWSDADECRRQADLAAGVEPRLNRYWLGTTTESLAASVEEVAAIAAPGDTALQAFLRHARKELLYRQPDPEQGAP